MDKLRERLGEPDLKLAGFQLWVHGPETASPKTDEDWLNVTAHCGAHGASVWASGALVQRVDLAGWIGSVGLLHRELSGFVRLAPLEQNLSVTLEVNRTGGIEMVVEVTPDPRNQRHRFQFDIDQSYLPPFLTQGRKLLDRYPPPGSSRG
jgi:hypothetical protein